MLSKTVNFLLFICLATSVAAAQSDSRLQYVDRYKEIAIRERERAGIPASIKLAQAILESNAGESLLARRANNHFGIKCGNDWNGKTFHKKDDDYNEKGQLVESCFRSYRNPEASFIAHSEFLRDPKKQFRYGFLFRIDPTDYRAWAEGLRRAGYATSATYSRKLIDIIERYELHRYDQLSSVEIIAGEDGVIEEGGDIGVSPGLVFENNDVRYALAKSEETPADIALRAGASINDILKYNEKLAGRDQKLQEGTVVYLQKKRRSFRGKRKWHYVQEGESMYDIAQMYGIQLDRLYERNRIPTNAQPAKGQRVKIRGCKVNTQPKLSSEARQEETAIPPEAREPIDEDEDGEVDFEGEISLDEPEPAPPVVEDPTPRVPPLVIDEEENVTPDEGFGDELELEEEPTQPATVHHTVQRGDTLYSISRRYDTTVEAIKRLNNLTSNIINIGQRLRVK